MFVYQDTEGYTINIFDCYDPGVGEVYATYELYARKNGGSWQDCNKSVIFDGTEEGNSQTLTGTLPFSITWNDNVDFLIQ